MARPKGTTRAESPSRPVSLWLSPGEFNLAKAAAEVNQQSVSEFIRNAILEATSTQLETSAGSP